jgi:hypothetical protein
MAMALIVILAAAPVVVFALGLSWWRDLTAESLGPIEGRARRRSALATGAAFAAGALGICLWNVMAPLSDAIRLATTPALAGTAVILASAVAERTWPRPEGAVRTASLARRPAVGSRHLRRALWVASALAALLLGIGAATATPDGQGLERTWTDGAASHGPYPGAPYGLPIAAAIVLLIASTVLALRLVDSRPALGVGHQILDVAIREASAVRVLRGAVFGTTATAAGLLQVMGAAILGVTGDGAPPAPLLRAVGMLSVSLAVFAMLVALAAVAWPSPRVRGPVRPRRTTPA